MSCLQPISILDKNRGTSSSDGRINVPCGRCPPCLKKRRNHWSFRLYEELKISKTAYFITLTYEDKYLPLHPSGFYTLNKADVQKFIKRLRKAQNKIDKDFSSGYSRSIRNFRLSGKNGSETRRSTSLKVRQKLRYYACGEYGEETDRPHYHIILFNLHPELKDKIPEIWSINGKSLGHVHVGTANVKTIAYTTKYVLKQSTIKKEGRLSPFSLMSRKPAIGYSYVENNKSYHQNLLKMTVRSASGKEQSMPRHFKQEIFTKDQIKVISKRDLKVSDKEKLMLEEKLRKKGVDVGLLELSEMKAMLRKIDKINKTDKL